MLITDRDEEKSYQITSSVLSLWSREINLSKITKTGKKLMIDAVDDITSTCDICIKYKTIRPWLAVGLPMANDFNETVAMDLVNTGNKIWFIRLIDLFTQFSVAKTITTKEKNVVTDTIFKI